MTKEIKVLIIDDSALVRTLLTEILQSEPSIKVVGAAVDPIEARDMIKQFSPDVLTLDIEMPKMNGIAFLSNLMRLRPMPVVMISTLTHAGAPATLEALELGAIDFLPKPKDGSSAHLADYKATIISKVRAAANANISARDSLGVDTSKVKCSSGQKLKSNFICAIGASTGGTEAIKEVLRVLPKQSPPILIAQHIPAAFSTSFAERLNKNCDITVFEAEHNQAIRAGCAYLAPGDKHLVLEKSPYGFICKLLDTDRVNRHKPSVEVLFDSVTKHAGSNAMGVMLTGMGADGAEAMLRMKEAGMETVAQDEATSVVWGMPGAAVKLGAVDHVLPLNKIAGKIINKAYSR